MGLAVGLLGVALSTGTAAAQLPGNDFSETPGETTTTTVPGEELGAGEEVGAPGAGELPSEEAAGEEAAAEPGGTLPFTGGDVVGLAVIGALAVGAGVVLIRRSKTA